MTRYIKVIAVIALVSILSTTNPAQAAQQTGTAQKIMNETLDMSKIVFQEIASGFINPVFITNAGDGSGRLFIIERAGRIRIIKNGIPLATPFLDIQAIVKSTSGEQGLLALAFHPAYSTNGKFFIAYTAPRNGDNVGSNLILEQFTVSSNPNIANPTSGSILLTIAHPSHSNHNGGGLAFGQDGYLYWTTGDGGSGGDPNNNAQNLNKLLGKVLRIDVNSGSPYGIPITNPFYSNPDPNIRKEIWAYGLRNSWRFSFDSLTDDIYIGDVGQNEREEIDFQLAGGAGGENYGWRVMEGSLCYNPPSGCDQSGKTLPVAEYDHSIGCAVTGGYVYRGNTFPSLYGHYFYADYCTGIFFNLYRNSTPAWEPVQSMDTPYYVSTFGEDEQKEMYLADYSTGKIYSIGYQITPPVTITYQSNGVNDGWVLESSQTSNKGGSLNSTAMIFAVGDNAANKQFRGILHFDTSSLPDTAIITSATLKVKKQGLAGTNPFVTHTGLRMDIRKPYLGPGMGLELADFQATPNRSSVAAFNSTPSGGWYSAPLNYIGKSRINLVGTTQFRLRFGTGDNNDNNADYIRFFSGNAGVTNRPKLLITYYMP
jgi:glucose/arabinose dehydrogenase